MKINKLLKNKNVTLQNKLLTVLIILQTIVPTCFLVSINLPYKHKILIYFNKPRAIVSIPEIELTHNRVEFEIALSIRLSNNGDIYNCVV